jgi:hypothetical protein
VLRAVSRVEPLTTNGKSGTYGYFEAFALRYRRVNATSYEAIKICASRIGIKVAASYSNSFLLSPSASALTTRRGASYKGYSLSKRLYTVVGGKVCVYKLLLQNGNFFLIY